MGMLQHIDAIGMRQRECDVLLAEQHRDVGRLAQFLQCLRQRFENDGRKAERRLVENQNLRLHHQGPADRQHLLFAAGQRLRHLALAILQDRKQIEQPVHLLGALIVSEMLAAEIEIFADAHFAEQFAAFRTLHEATARDFGRCQAT